MSPRRHWLPLLSALALLLTPFALAPRFTQAQTNQYVVDKTSDDQPAANTCTAAVNDCSLRQALTLANSDSGPSTITFFAGIYGQTITLADPSDPLPPLSGGNTTINAFVGLPRIAINGAGSGFDGLKITSSGNTVTGLSIYGFICSNNGAGGIVIEGAGITSNIIDSNYIGVDLNGTPPAANRRNCNGVVVRNGPSSNTIRNNVISASDFDGVLIQNASDNVVIGNRIGFGPIPNDTTVIGNEQNGVSLFSLGGQSTLRNRVGGTAFNEQNVIVGSGSESPAFAGIRVQGSGTLTSTISSNYIGTDSIGSVDRGNFGDGILVIAGARGTQIQGTNAAPLVISGNDGYGIRITGGTTLSTTVSSAYIGINGAGGTLSAGVYPTATIPNTLDGIRVDSGARGTTITGTATDRMVIAGNGGRGIAIDGASTATTVVQNALIGAIVAGASSAPQPNTQGGVLVNGARQTTIAGNTISGNATFGLRLTGATTTTVTANFIGLSLDRKAAQGNAGPGIDVQGSANTLIGGSAAAANFIAGNGGPAIALANNGATATFSTTVRANQIGLVQQPASTFYTARGANTGEGVRVSGTVQQTVISANTIAASADTTATDYPGVLLAGTGSGNGGITGVSVTANRIGWLPQSEGSTVFVPYPNADGVQLTGGVQSAQILSNTIRLNLGAAVRLTDAITPTVRANLMLRNAEGGVIVDGASRALTIERNGIAESGRTSDGTSVLNAAADGIFLNTAATISGATIISNTISANTGRGIALQGDVNRASMRFNLLSRNGGPIRLVGSTIYPGSGADPDTQLTPNHGIDPPIVDLSFTRPLSLRVNQQGFVEGYVYTSTNRVESTLSPISACITCTIQVFRPDRSVPADTQGGELLFTLPSAGGTTPRDTIAVAANGRFSARIVDELPERLLFIATDGFGNSSEYATFPILPSLNLEATSALAANAAPGDTVTYTLRLRNTGTLGYNNLVLGTSGTLERWTVATDPISNTGFALAAGASRDITVTLTLPTGSDPNVAAGKKDVTTITIAGGPPVVSATAKLETTVLPRPVISVTPPTSTGSGAPQTPVPHAFTIRNNGNVTVTLDLSYFTKDPASSPGVWATTLNASTLTLGPGGDARVGLSVTVPAGALANTTATTTLTATVRPGVNPAFPGQTVNFTATTRADLSPNADLFPDVEAQAGAGGTIPITHNVENKSNGTATFCLDYFTSNQSTVRFVPLSPNFVIDSRGCFTLYAIEDVAQGRYVLAQLNAQVTLNDRLTPGTIETVTIFLRKDSPTGESISDATVQDKIRITTAPIRPRVWLPVIRQ